MRTGLLGGTFDPIHIGHLILAQEAWHQLKLDRVQFIPAYLPPHKDTSGGASPADRLNMVRLAVEGIGHFSVSTIELDLRERSYTIDTVVRLKERSDDELFFLAGGDVAGDLSEWKDHDRLLEEVVFVIASREGFDADLLQGQRVTRIDIPNIGVSSSSIRERIRNGSPVDHMVPQRVLAYIRRKGLYRQE